MTDLATALAARPIGDFEGRTVIGSTVAITRAGDGLSEAMKFDPIEMVHGDRVYVILECEVAKVRFDPIKNSDALTRVHILRAGSATMVDESLVKDHLEAQADRIRLAREAAAGIQRLPERDGGDLDEDE